MIDGDDDEHERNYNRIQVPKHFDDGRVFVVTEAYRLEGRLEAMHQVET